MGVNQGMQPIAGYNYGAQQIDRLMSVLRYAIVVATLIMLSGWIVAEFLPYYSVRLFTKDATLIGLSASGLRILMAAMPFVGSQMVITNFFQSIGKVKISIFLSLSRQLLYLLPLLYVFPLSLGLNGVWYAMPVSDMLSFVVTVWILVVYIRKFKMEQQREEVAAV